MDYRLETGIDQRIVTRFDYKLSIIRRLLPLYDWLVWMDDDAFFTDFTSDSLSSLIHRAERGGQSLIFAEGPLEPNGFWSRINSGVMVLRNDETARHVLDRAAHVDLATVRTWWDDDRDGLFTRGDQDQLWWSIRTSGVEESVLIVDHRELNSRGHYYRDSLQDAFIMHFTGYPDKELGIARFADRWGVGQELVPRELLDKYHVRVRSPLRGIERAWRACRTDALTATKHKLRPHKEIILRMSAALPPKIRRRLPLDVD